LEVLHKVHFKIGGKKEHLFTGIDGEGPWFASLPEGFLIGNQGTDKRLKKKSQ